jgi:hypothetical protein
MKVLPLTTGLLAGENLAAAILRYRKWIVIVCTIATLAMALGATRIGFSTDYRVFFQDADPHLIAFDALQATYQKEDSVLLVIKPRDGDVFTVETLSLLRDLTRDAWLLPYATRVDSIANFQHSEAVGDDITVQALLRRKDKIDQNTTKRLRRIALSEPLLVGRIIAPDASTTGISIIFTLPEGDRDAVPETMRAVRDLSDRYATRLPGGRIAITGTVALNNAFVEAATGDMTTLFPAVYGVVFLVAMLIFPSLGAVIGIIAVVGLSTAAAAGLAGWAGVMLNPVSAAAPLIITTVATADAVHLLSVMYSRMREGASKSEAIAYSLRINFFPIFLTSLTTVIGFLSLNFSDSPPFHDLGNITAIGVVIAWLLSITLLPALLSLLPTGKAGLLNRLRFMENRCGVWVTTHPRRVLAITGFIAVFLISWIPRIEFNDQFVNYFDQSIQFRSDTDFAAENLSGIYHLEFSIKAEREGNIAEPAFLKRLESFVTWLRNQPEVTHVNALPDIIKRLNRNMNEDRDGFYKLPATRELAAQYLLLFEMSLSRGLDLRNQINIDRTETRVIATLKNITTYETQSIRDRAEAWLRANMAQKGEALATGPAVMFSYIYQNNIRAMFKGTAIALVLISLCLLIALKNFKLGLISIIPNAVPALMAFGIWSLAVGQAGLAAAVVTAITLGLIVDNTVHFLSKYQWAREREAKPPREAALTAYKIVGPAVIGTSAILVLGFIVLSFSSFQANAQLGMLSVITILCALATDLLTLPALLITIDGDTGPSRPQPNSEQS